MKTTFKSEEIKLFIFWQKKQEKMIKYNLLKQQIYKLDEEEIIQLIKDLQTKEFDNKMSNIYIR